MALLLPPTKLASTAYARLRDWRPNSSARRIVANGTNAATRHVGSNDRFRRQDRITSSERIQRWSAPIVRFAKLNLSTSISIANLSNAWPSIGSCKVICW